MRAQASDDAQRAINGLLPLLRWFRTTFALLPPELMEPDTLVQRVETPAEQVG